ncbi:MAG: tyrosine-type recombinase/integrase [Candidatus Micrarchaeota archaeon]|nr:tyrosine-type recombinase/integrase [Candidatus Micrarchaeota archaeon]
MDSISSSPPTYTTSAAYDVVRLAHFKNVLKTDEAIIPANKIDLMKFISHMESRGITISRCRSLMDDIMWFGRLLKKRWMDCTREDIDELMADLRRTDYAGWTKLRKAFALKTFYRYLNGGDSPPHCVARINRTELNFETHNLESRDILSLEDLQKLLKACDNELESALIYCLWESGARSSEFMRLTIGDLEDKGNFYLVHIRTSKVRASSSAPRVRKFPLVESVGFLRAYLNKHPMRDNPQAALWLSNSQNRRRQPLTDRGLRFIIKGIGKRAKIGKRVWVHQFRHSAATRMAPKLSLPIMNDLMGWSKSSRMHATYVQLDGEASQRAVLELYGMEAPQSKPKPVEMLPCPACKTPNLPGNVMCAICGRALQTIGAVSVMDELEQMKKKMNQMMLPAARGSVTRAKRAAQRKMLRKKRA